MQNDRSHPIYEVNPSEHDKDPRDYLDREEVVSLGEKLKGFIPGINLDGLQKDGSILRGDAHVFGTASPAEGIMSVFLGLSYLTMSAELLNESGDKERRDLEKLLEKFADGIVIDLGAGVKSYGYYLVRKVKAKGYIGVEATRPDDLQKDIQAGVDRSKKAGYPAMPFVVVAEEMLRFLKRLPENCASVITSTIDNCVVPNSQVMRELGEEIWRVIGTDHIYLTNQSQVPLPKGVKYRVYNLDNSTIPAWDDISDGIDGQLPGKAIVEKSF